VRAGLPVRKLTESKMERAVRNRMEGCNVFEVCKRKKRRSRRMKLVFLQEKLNVWTVSGWKGYKIMVLWPGGLGSANQQSRMTIDGCCHGNSSGQSPRTR
jgi:hypothetical protein